MTQYIIIGLLLLLIGSRAYGSKGKSIPITIPYEHLFDSYSTIHNVPKRLMVAIVAHESRFNPMAVNEESEADKRRGRDIDSIGLGQILYPDTARALRPNITRSELFDPALNLKLAYELMSGLLRAHPRKDSDGFNSYAVAAYNAGAPRFNTKGEFVNQSYVNAVKKEWNKYDFI